MPKVPKSKPSPLKSGRPSKQQSIALEQELKQCFEKGQSAYEVYLTKGYEYKTIQIHYRKWLDSIENNDDFIQQQMDAKTEYVAVLTKYRPKFEEHVELLESMLEDARSAKKISKVKIDKLTSRRNSAIHSLLSINRTIFDTKTQPYLKDKLEEYIAKKIDTGEQEVVVIEQQTPKSSG